MQEKFCTKGQISVLAKTYMNDKLQNTYQKVNVLETSIFGYKFEKAQKHLPVYLNDFS